MMKTTLAALIALAASLTPAFAERGERSCNDDKRASVSCAEGTVWNSARRACVSLQS